MSSEPQVTAEKEKKNLFWTTRVANAIPDWRKLMKSERAQYRMDVTALLCRGNMSEQEQKRI